jgi:hypothetical protein
MVASPAEGKLMNNSFFGPPGSAHTGGVSYGLANGAVLFLSEQIDPNIFALLGSMADKEDAQLPDVDKR